MPRKQPISKLNLMLCTILPPLLFGCASHTVAVAACPKPAPLTPSMQVPAPPQGQFSKCLQEIVAVGRGQRAQISQTCSAFLHSKLTP